LKHIIKQKSPAEFEAWKKFKPRTRFEDLQSSDSKEEGEFDYSTKKLKAELLKEQNNLCCYCNAAIKNDHNTTIEHLKPKVGAKNQHLIFDYDNLLASCNGNRKEPKPRDLHCDAEKDIKLIELTPLMSQCETKIGYAENGAIFGISNKAKDTIGKLNLGCAKLTGERSDRIYGKLYKEIVSENSEFDYNDPANFERISKQEAAKLFNELSKTKSEPYIIAILQVLKQNFNLKN